MSNMTTAHDLVKYDAKNSKPFDGQRLAKVCFKTSKSQAIKPDNMCASIPVFSAHAQISDFTPLFPHMDAWLQGVQDQIVREMVENGAQVVTDSDISLDAIINWLEEDSKGNRLTKEFIIEWFSTELADVLTVAISDKLELSDSPSEAETKRVQQMINVYRDSFAQLAGGKTSFTPEKAKKMQKVLELISDNAMAQRFNARLEKMQQVESVEMLDL